MMQVLITGGNGFLGRHLVPALQQRGDAVRVLTLPAEDATWLERRGVSVRHGDVRQRQTLRAAMRGVEAVVHLAGMMGAWQPIEEYRSVNVTGTDNVWRAALDEGVSKMVHVSSWTVYGMGIGEPAREDFPLRPFADAYPLTKAEADLAVQRMIAEEDLPAVIIRPGTFFGPHDRLHFARMADRLRAKRGVVVGSGDNALPFVYVSDVVQGLLLALDHESAAGQVYNITNDQPLTQRDLLEAIATEIGAPSPRLHLPDRPLYAAAYLAERSSALAGGHRQPLRQPLVTRLGVELFGTDNRHAIDKARRDLGFSPSVSLREGIHLAAEWYLTKASEPPQATGQRWRHLRGSIRDAVSGTGRAGGTGTPSRTASASRTRN